jgi:hypothetical protein
MHCILDGFKFFKQIDMKKNILRFITLFLLAIAFSFASCAGKKKTTKEEGGGSGGSIVINPANKTENNTENNTNGGTIKINDETKKDETKKEETKKKSKVTKK